MSAKLTHVYDTDGGRVPAVLRIHDQNRNEIMSFTLRDYPEVHHEWLASVLMRQVEQIINDTERDTTRRIRKQLREALGL